MELIDYTIFLCQITLSKWLDFLLGFLTVTLNAALLDLFIYSDTNICSTVAFSPLGNSNHISVLVPIDFPSHSKGVAPFHRTAYNYCCVDWGHLCYQLRDVPWEDI